MKYEIKNIPQFIIQITVQSALIALLGCGVKAPPLPPLPLTPEQHETESLRETAIQPSPTPTGSSTQ